MNTEQLAALKSFLNALATPPDIVWRILAAAKAPVPQPDSLITTRAAAAQLAVHPKTVFRYRSRGLLHSVKRSPRSIRWRQSEVAALAAGGAQ